MSLFVPKEWKDRLAEFAGRRKLINVSTGEETTVDVSRAEGEVSQAGDAFSAANMNNLEQRIKDGFDKVDTNLATKIPAGIGVDQMVDLSNYTSNNPYTTPCDGYGMLSVHQGAYGNYLCVPHPTNTYKIILGCSDKPSASITMSVFIPKGTNIWASISTANQVFFIPFL